jgi:preprotein translocase subunit YajC
MDKFILPLLQSPAAGAEQGGGFGQMLMMFAIIIGIFYFLIIRPQSKRRKETEAMLSALKKGDKIVTIGGLYGTIQSVKEKTVIIKVDDNVKLEFLRSAISSVELPAKEKEEKTEKEPEKIEDSGEQEKPEEQSEEKSGEAGEANESGDKDE